MHPDAPVSAYLPLRYVLTDTLAVRTIFDPLRVESDHVIAGRAQRGMLAAALLRAGRDRQLHAWVARGIGSVSRRPIRDWSRVRTAGTGRSVSRSHHLLTCTHPASTPTPLSTCSGPRTPRCPTKRSGSPSPPTAPHGSSHARPQNGTWVLPTPVRTAEGCRFSPRPWIRARCSRHGGSCWGTTRKNFGNWPSRFWRFSQRRRAHSPWEAAVHE